MSLTPKSIPSAVLIRTYTVYSPLVYQPPNIITMSMP